MVCFDYLINKINEYKIRDYNFIQLPKYGSKVFPVINKNRPLSFQNTLADLKEQLEFAKVNSFCIRIKYLNKHNKVSIRTIKDFELITFKVKKANGLIEVVSFLNGYCFLKEEERTFRISRIQKLEILRFKSKKIKSKKDSIKVDNHYE